MKDKRDRTEYAKIYRAEHKKEISEGGKKYYQKNKERLRAMGIERYRKRVMTPEKREYVRLMAIKMRKKYPVKAKARITLRTAILAGKIERGACQVCGKPKGEGHHDNYDKPLEVIWLCSLHHRHLHFGIISRDSIK